MIAEQVTNLWMSESHFIAVFCTVFGFTLHPWANNPQIICQPSSVKYGFYHMVRILSQILAGYSHKLGATIVLVYGDDKTPLQIEWSVTRLVFAFLLC